MSPFYDAKLVQGEPKDKLCDEEPTHIILSQVKHPLSNDDIVRSQVVVLLNCEDKKRMCMYQPE
jgi:hypothetical protein